MILPFLAALIVACPARTEESAESIQAVIVAQLQAFQANDLSAAFAHASPDIQSKFGTPETFGRMVATGYPMIWRPESYEMLDFRHASMGPIQTVSFQDAQGRFFEAAYGMRQVDGVWRINGVYLQRSAGVGS
jgi:hypothetical protein